MAQDQAPARLPTHPGENAAFTVAITGHRTIAHSHYATLESRISALLDKVRARMCASRAETGEPLATLRLISALAPGADQIAARAALLADGWQLHAFLPFDLDDYSRIAHAALHQRMAELAPGTEPLADAEIVAAIHAIAELTDKAAMVLLPEDWLPPAQADDTEATRYAALGEALVAQADLLLALWDGQAPRGPGGTGDVVAMAFAHSVPVIRIDPQPPHTVSGLAPGDMSLDRGIEPALAAAIGRYATKGVAEHADS
ncbi:hypothetical protein [Altererythrobacter lauratis]|uniref:Uncharacterized protein n=1 Tax=Alteraurantiacibacter lauratis TaxID=2054627 RepID=A0ABV7EDB0_9SPHN